MSIKRAPGEGDDGSHAGPKVKILRESAPQSAAAKLPNDVLVFIVALFPLRPRLLSLSRVCKQWRAATLRSVTTLHRGDENVARALSIFPCLTDLELRGRALRGKILSIPSGVCRLGLGSWLSVGQSETPVLQDPPPARLQHLLLSCLNAPSLLASLAQTSFFSLTSLSLSASAMALSSVPSLSACLH